MASYLGYNTTLGVSVANHQTPLNFVVETGLSINCSSSAVLNYQQP